MLTYLLQLSVCFQIKYPVHRLESKAPNWAKAYAVVQFITLMTLYLFWGRSNKQDVRCSGCSPPTYTLAASLSHAILGAHVLSDRRQRVYQLGVRRKVNTNDLYMLIQPTRSLSGRTLSKSRSYASSLTSPV